MFNSTVTKSSYFNICYVQMRPNIILLRKYNLELYLTATERTEYTEGSCYVLCALCALCGRKSKKVDIV